jgi:hypothetical protein
MRIGEVAAQARAPLAVLIRRPRCVSQQNLPACQVYSKSLLSKLGMLKAGVPRRFSCRCENSVRKKRA